MGEIRIVVETETELKQADRFAIEDAIAEALRKIGIEPTSVRVIW